MKKVYLSLLLIVVAFVSNAQVPAGYYDGATGSGFVLKSNLHDIIDGHTSISYSSVWDVYDESDIDPKDGFIWDIYSEIANPAGANTDGNDPYNYIFSTNQCGNFSGEGSCYNREHTVPASWFDDAFPMFSDVHHVFPTDGSVNGRRSNFPYGEVGTATFTSQNGSMVGSARAGLGYSGTVFEPIDEFKGDIARVYFYMATRYEDVISTWQNNSSQADAALNGTTDQVFEDWVVAMLLDWHANDPVDAKETVRNEAIFDVQGNRNPFVDRPEFVAMIWDPNAMPGETENTFNYEYLNFNEVLISTSGTDFEIVELVGIPGQSLTDLSILSVDANGVVATENSLTGEEIPMDGFWVAANTLAAASVIEDYLLPSDYQNETSTFFLVEGFSGNVGDDLDTNNDGSLDVEPWDQIIDDLALQDNNGGSIYSANFLGPDGNFLSPGGYRSSDGCGSWVQHDFGTASTDATPGASNGTSCFTAFNGTTWTAGTPDATIEAVIAADRMGSLVSSDLLVVDGVTVEISAGEHINVGAQLTNNGEMIIGSGGALLTEGSISGDGSFMIQRNTTFDENTGQYSFVSAPTANGEINDLGRLVFEYDESVLYQEGINDGLDRYVAPTTTLMNVAQGYASAFTGTIEFNGVPNTGNISIDITKTDHSQTDVSEEDFEGFDLVGNPYPSAIRLTDFLAANNDIEGAIWIWDDNNPPGIRGDSGDFITINSLGEVSGGTRNDWNGYIGSMQGFFVKVLESANPGTYAVDFNNGMRDIGNNTDQTFFRGQSDFASFKLNVTTRDGSIRDETLVGFIADATEGKDRNYDATKFSGQELRIYSMRGEDKYAIQGLPEITTSQIVELGLRYSASFDTYEISLTDLQNLEEDIILHDRITGGTWDFSNGPYAFQTAEEEENNRFSLQVGGQVTSTATELGIGWRVGKDQVIVSGVSDEKASLSVTDLMGRDVLHVPFGQRVGNEIRFDVNLSNNNIYLITLYHNDSRDQIKLVIR